MLLLLNIKTISLKIFDKNYIKSIISNNKKKEPMEETKNINESSRRGRRKILF